MYFYHQNMSHKVFLYHGAVYTSTEEGSKYMDTSVFCSLNGTTVTVAMVITQKTSPTKLQLGTNRIISIIWSWCPGVTGLLCSCKERYRCTTAGAQQPNRGCVWLVTQKNQVANQLQVTAPIQSHNLPLHYKILVQPVKIEQIEMRFLVKPKIQQQRKECLWNLLVVEGIWNINECNTTEQVQ